MSLRGVWFTVGNGRAPARQSARCDEQDCRRQETGVDAGNALNDALNN